MRYVAAYLLVGIVWASFAVSVDNGAIWLWTTLANALLWPVCMTAAGLLSLWLGYVVA